MSSKKKLLSLCSLLGINTTKLNKLPKKKIKEVIENFEQNKKIKVISSGKNIKYIYHCADIHIRVLDRHQEYRQVFHNLYKELLNNGDLDQSVLVICGDIFHNKDRLVAETIVLFNEFIELMTSIIDTVVILGNHDIYSSADRIDTISGITNIKQYPNFHFLKSSGVYCYNNIDFVVSSLLDNTFIKYSDVNNNNNTKVCLYHGAVNGSLLDNNTTFNDETRNYSIKDFSGFDYVLLGDIHKKQYLKPHIAYPGSLIQQNFKEHVDHGIIKWDIERKTSAFIKIHNDYGYITLYSDETHEQKYPKYSRIKLVHNYSENIDYEKIKERISLETNILSVSKEINKNSIDTGMKSECPSQEEIFNNYINQYDPEIKNKLHSLHKNCLEEYEDQIPQTSVCNWYISKLTFKNIYMYGDNDDNIIYFPLKNKIIGLLANNACGKSSIINIILYALFGNITKTKSFLNRNIINKNQSKYRLSLEIIMNDKKYTIIREGKNKIRKNNIKSMDETLEFTVSGSDKIVTDLTDHNKISTQEKIKQTFGLIDKHLFILTNLMNYTDYTSILNMTSSDIGSVFSKLFNIDYFKAIYSSILKKGKMISEKIQFHNKEIDILQKLNNSNEKENHIEKHKNVLNEIDAISNDIDKIKKEIKSNEESINYQCSLKEDKLKKTKEDIIERLNNSEEIVYYLTGESKNDIIKSIKQLNSQIIPDKGETRSYLTIDELKKNINDLKNKKIFTDDFYLEEKYKQSNNSIETFEYNLDVIKEIKYSEKNKEISIDKEYFSKLKNTLDKFQNISELLSEYKTNVKITKNYDDYLSKKRHEEKRLQDLDYAYKCLNYKINEELKFLKHAYEIIDLKEHLVLLNNKSYKLEIDKYQNILKEKIKIKDTLMMEKGRLKNILEQNKDSKTTIKKLKDEIDILEKELKIYKIYKDIVNDKCLPKTILNNTIKQVQSEANGMIYPLIGLFVYISGETDEEDNKWEVLIKKNNMILGSEQISGYERFIINIGVKLALDKYKFFPGCSTFFIDEVFDCVSEENLENIDNVFDYLKTYYRNILIISHNEELKKKVDSKINIKTDFITSKIEQ